MEDGILLNTFSSMKTIPIQMDLMDLFGGVKIIRMRGLSNLVIWINRLRIVLIGRKFLGCLGKSSSLIFIPYHAFPFSIRGRLSTGTAGIELMVGTTLECKSSVNPLGISVDISSNDGIFSSGPRYVSFYSALRTSWSRINTDCQNHKRRLPFLIPATDFTERELHDLGLQGTCEVQICRSVGPWSMGTLTKIEHSIQNAYCKCESSLSSSSGDPSFPFPWFKEDQERKKY